MFPDWGRCTRSNRELWWPCSMIVLSTWLGNGGRNYAKCFALSQAVKCWCGSLMVTTRHSLISRQDTHQTTAHYIQLQPMIYSKKDTKLRVTYFVFVWFLFTNEFPTDKFALEMAITAISRPGLMKRDREEVNKLISVTHMPS